MTPEQQAAYVQAQAVCALAEIEAMRAENTQRAQRGEPITHRAKDFEAIPAAYGITRNQIVELFHPEMRTRP